MDEIEDPRMKSPSLLQTPGLNIPSLDVDTEDSDCEIIVRKINY